MTSPPTPLVKPRDLRPARPARWGAWAKKPPQPSGARKFLVDEARSQSGNALGFAAGAIVTGAVAILAGPAVAASAVVVGSALLAGVAVQIVWNLAGGADAADAFASGALK